MKVSDVLERMRKDEMFSHYFSNRSDGCVFWESGSKIKPVIQFVLHNFEEGRIGWKRLWVIQHAINEDEVSTDVIITKMKEIIGFKE